MSQLHNMSGLVYCTSPTALRLSGFFSLKEVYLTEIIRYKYYVRVYQDRIEFCLKK